MAPAEAMTGLGHGAVERLGELVRVRTRMQMRPRTLTIVARVAERRAAERGLDPDAYVEHVILMQDAAELEHLVAELTVGETHFFRGPPQFEALRRDIVPALIQKRRSPVIRALSAGCATGEEAYSLAIVLHESVPSPAWQIEVTGVDINARFLQKAEAARYTPWSLRDVPDVVRRRYFEADGDMLAFTDGLRRLVKFRRFGLTERPLRSTFHADFDLVVCQNVLYYLEPDARPSVIASLVDVLAPGGVLVLGPVDHSGDVPRCRSVHVGDVVVYERTDEAHPAPMAPRSIEQPTPHVSLPGFVEAQSLLPASAKGALVSSPSPSLDDAFAAADAGDLRSALQMLGAVLDAEPEEPRAHLLMGLLLVELGRFEEALDAFRRCVYLDSSMMLALTGASVAARRSGRDELAERYAARLRALGREKNVDAPVEGWDGMTVGSLLRLFRDGNLRALRTSEGLSR